MMSHKKIHRFLVAALPPITVGETITISEERIVHQVHRVLKLQPGETVIVFIDKGNNTIAEIVSINDTLLTIKIISSAPIHPVPRTIIAVISIIKGDAFELIVQKLTELGVHTIVPLIAGRTVKQKIRKDRLQTISDEALEQSGGTTRVTITEPLSLSDCLKQYPFQSVVLNPLSVTTSLEQCTDTIVYYVGPEGGWDEHDEVLIHSINCQQLQITTHVLRTETAAILGAYALLWSH